MSQPVGMLGLFGSGEYTTQMLPIEEKLVRAGIDSGKTGGYVQFATAAGKESEDRITYWKNLGQKQAERLGIEWKFIPVFNREDTENLEYLEMIKGASLIYFSGGNPVHLVKTFKDTLMLNKIFEEFSQGTSLAGCSAGAMALSADAGIHWRKNGERHEGFGVVPGIKVFPHYDKFFGHIPSPIRNKIANADTNLISIGIDEMTGLIWDSNTWTVAGNGYVHLIGKHSHDSKTKFKSGDNFPEISRPVVRI